jgi:hypothetical protein
MVLPTCQVRRNTESMQFTMRNKPPQVLLLSILAGARTVALAPVILLRWCLRAPFLSLGVVFRVVGGRAMAVWWSAALFLISRGNAAADRQDRGTVSLRRNKTRPCRTEAELTC